MPYPLILFGNVQIAAKGPVNLRRVRWRILGISEQEIGLNPRTARLYVPDQLPLGNGSYLLFLRRFDFRITAR